MWNKLPTAVTQAMLELALKEPELSPRELTVSFIDQQRYSKLTVEKRPESKPIKVQVN